MKHKVTMLKTAHGVDDGHIYPQSFIEGEEYSIGEELLRAFIDLGVVELADQPKAIPAMQRDTKIVAPEETKPMKPVAKK